MTEPALLLFIAIGLGAGVLSGVFGLGGGVVLVPALVYLAGFSQRMAAGTSLAILLPPIGLGAVIEYYRHGEVDLRAAAVMAIGTAAGGWLGAVLANHVDVSYLRVGFALFVLIIGASLMVSAIRQWPAA